ncbi:MAG: iron uptake system protein EfeO [Lautropia sp.]|nr:iron uptake system protein EfeO [Lautropia sp.]
MSVSKPPSSALLRAASIGSGLLVVAGLGAFWYASQHAQRQQPTDEEVVTITIQGKVCNPSDITVPAGRTTFEIINQSDRALEWEILDGVMVVEERENIAPGFSQTMRVKLRPGTYEITCGLLSNPRGKLTVTSSAASEAEASKPPPTHYIGPLAEYRVYLIMQTTRLQAAVEQMVEAMDAGDLQAARARYIEAHANYQRIEPMSDLFGDLDQRLNARADYFEQREADPAFHGFHRIAHGLFEVERVEPKVLKPVAEQLTTDLAELRQRLSSLDIEPGRLAGSAAKLLRRKADNLPALDAPYDNPALLPDLQGTLDGTQKLARLVLPLLDKPAPELKHAIEQGYVTFGAALDPYREGDGFKAVTLDEAQRQALAGPIRRLAEDLDRVNTSLGLD